MYQSSHLDQLRDAVRKELSDEELRANRCDGFLAQITRFLDGQGTLPDEQQFLLWREDLKKTMAVHALKAAMDLPEQDDPAYDLAPSTPRPAMSPGCGRRNDGVDTPAS